METFVPIALREKVLDWRKKGYPCEYPAISEIFDYCFNRETDGTWNVFLRKAQFEAFETYWYLRIVEKTPHIIDLYKRLFSDPADLLKALDIIIPSDELVRLLSYGGFNSILEKILTDDEFVKKHRFEAVRESLSLSYPSYILALAMGAGKTVLIGAIIATEFALSLEYHNTFVKNALVFAPGKTILGALKQLSDIPFERILPPRLCKQFLSNVKFTYTHDNENNIPIISGSTYNIIVTNTEKIRIQKSNEKAIQTNFLNVKNNLKIQQQDIANLRLQTIASLPQLAIFSDEAHHTYGQSLDNELKKVRQTVDYLAENTDVIVVVNTTGTPYFNKQMLKDVVFWYGLSQGIKDGILKDVHNSIYSYQNVTSEEFLNMVIADFFEKYENVVIHDGSKAKIAIYFPQTDDIKIYKPIIEKRIAELGLDPSIVFEVHNKSEEKTKDYFNNRLNDPKNPYRVYLLVNMGTEGWNCLSLFATVLARKLKSSNNFVLQAASRCLRQVPNNTVKASIYLSNENVHVLDTQLRETFGESLQVLETTKQDLISQRIIVRNADILPIVIKKKIQAIRRIAEANNQIRLEKPSVTEKEAIRKVYDANISIESKKVLIEKERQKVDLEEPCIDLFAISTELAAIYRLSPMSLYQQLLILYPDGDIPKSNIDRIKSQIEEQTKNYQIIEEEVEQALAIVKPNGFIKEVLDGKTVYTSEIIYHKDKADLLISYNKLSLESKDLSFHYTPYNMRSNPERNFFLGMLETLNEEPDEIESILYTGAIVDPKKTDILFEYKDKNGKWRSYTPDFVIRKKNGKVLIVEIKGEIFRDESKEIALRKIEKLNPQSLKYEILTTEGKDVRFDELSRVKNWINEVKNNE
jgi:type III restriction enzyme